MRFASQWIASALLQVVFTAADPDREITLNCDGEAEVFTGLPDFMEEDYIDVENEYNFPSNTDDEKPIEGVGDFSNRFPISSLGNSEPVNSDSRNGGRNQLFENDLWSDPQQNALRRMEEKIRLLSSQISDTIFTTENLETPQTTKRPVKLRKINSVAHRNRCFWRHGRVFCGPQYSRPLFRRRPFYFGRQQPFFPSQRPYFRDPSLPLITRIQPRPELRRRFLGRNFQHCDFLRANNEASRDGVYRALINGKNETIYCQFDESGQNWLVIQRRFDGTVDFFQTWSQYETGFGNLNGEFWLGLRLINDITRTKHHILRVELQDFVGDTAYAEYSRFVVLGPSSNYSLLIGGYSGTAGDGLAYHNGFPFSTMDEDHDFHYDGRNCAVDSHGAWWYNSCQHSNLNGQYFENLTRNIQGLEWVPWRRDHYSMKETTMKIRRASTP